MFNERFSATVVIAIRVVIAICATLTIIPFTEPSWADTTVSGDPTAGAIIIEGYQPGTSTVADSTPPCVEHVLVPQPDVLPADSIVAMPCRANPTTIARVTDELRERVVRYLPAPAAGTSPPRGALVNVPVVAFSGQHAVTLHARVLGEHVTVRLSPTYLWRWGDRTRLQTTRAGRPYPSRAITHTYRRSCRCVIRLETAWTGSWSFDDGESFPLDAVLTQKTRLTLSVREAPIRLTR